MGRHSCCVVAWIGALCNMGGRQGVILVSHAFREPCAWEPAVLEARVAPAG